MVTMYPFPLAGWFPYHHHDWDGVGVGGTHYGSHMDHGPREQPGFRQDKERYLVEVAALAVQFAGTVQGTPRGHVEVTWRPGCSLSFARSFITNIWVCAKP